MCNLYTVQKREKSNSRGSYCLSLLDSNHCYYHPICGYWVLNSQAFKLQSPRPPGRVAISSSGVKVCGSEIRKKFPAWSVLELWDQNLCEVVVFVLFWLWSCLTRSMEYLCHQSKFLSAIFLDFSVLCHVCRVLSDYIRFFITLRILILRSILNHLVFVKQ